MRREDKSTDFTNEQELPRWQSNALCWKGYQLKAHRQQMWMNSFLSGVACDWEQVCVHMCVNCTLVPFVLPVKQGTEFAYTCRKGKFMRRLYLASGGLTCFNSGSYLETQTDRWSTKNILKYLKLNCERKFKIIILVTHTFWDLLNDFNFICMS